jgi:oligopeptide transport system permease protein
MATETIQPTSSASSQVLQQVGAADLLAMKTKPRSLLMDALYRLLRNKAAVIGLVIIALFFIIAMFASVISPENPLKINSGKRFVPASWIVRPAGQVSGEPRFFLGTDSLGRDLFSRVIYGARVSMFVGLVPTFIIIVVGTVIGLVAGYYGSWIDNLLMRFTDVMYAFPDLLFFIIVMISLRDTWLGQMFNGLFLLFIVLAIVNWVGEARVVRGQVLSLKEKEFVEAARCIGATDSHIMFKHILPNTLGPIIILTAFTIPGMIITEAILGYLGLGMRPSTNPENFFITSWGALLLDGQSAINAQPWIILAPAICVSLVVLSFTFLGDGLRDAFDPKMRGNS